MCKAKSKLCKAIESVLENYRKVLNFLYPKFIKIPTILTAGLIKVMKEINQD